MPNKIKNTHLSKRKSQPQGGVKSTLLRNELEDLYQKYNHFHFIAPDPLQYVWEYSKNEDQEVVGLIISSLSYGNVKQILASGEKLLKPLGKNPARFLRENTENEIKQITKNFKHRWHTGDDLSALMIGVKNILLKGKTLEDIFVDYIQPSHTHLLPAISGFVQTVIDHAPPFRKNLLPFPDLKSACKRLMMYTRWMVRNDSVDPGPWGRISPALLLMPLDTHSFRFCREKKITNRNQANMQSVVEISESFKKISPEDPIKYDFAISRLGIRRNLPTG